MPMHRSLINTTCTLQQTNMQIFQKYDKKQNRSDIAMHLLFIQHKTIILGGNLPQHPTISKSLIKTIEMSWLVEFD